MRLYRYAVQVLMSNQATCEPSCQGESMQDDTYISVVPVEYLYHTPTHPFCYEENCPCHTDADNLAQVQEDYKAGLLTAEEVDMIIKGKTL